MDNNFEHMLEQAVEQMINRELAAIPPVEELQQRYQISDDFYKRMEQLLANQEKKTVRKMKCLKGMVIAACILVFVMWWNPELWAKAKNIIWEWLDSHVSFHLEVDSAKLDERGAYYFDYLPDRYEVVEQDMTGNMGFITCYDEEGHCLELIYTAGGNVAGFDNNEKVIQEMYEDGIQFYYLQSMTGEDNVLIWKDEEENVSFSLFSVLDYEQMQRIRKGITRAESR